jgi:hypothetical protein
MKDLYTKSLRDAINEDEGVYTYGDDIADTFMNGNFSAGVKQLKELNCRARDLADYLEEKAEEYRCKLEDMYYGHFTPNFWIALGSEIY